MLAAVSGSEMHSEATLRGERGDVRVSEHLQDGQFLYQPADAYTDEGELRVYTQPLRRAVRMIRYAVHDVVTIRLASCMEPWQRGENGEMHTAVVIHQHHDGSCDVRLVDDLATTVRSVHPQLSATTLNADAHARVSEYDQDIQTYTTLAICTPRAKPMCHDTRRQRHG